MIILETKHFILRQVTHADLDDFITFWDDENVMRFIGDGTWGGGKEVVSKFISDFIRTYALNPQFGSWAVQDKKTGRVIGEAGLALVIGKDEIEVGYILHRDYWGKGYGTEILTGIIDYGFNKLKLTQIIAVAHPENFGSTKVMQKCGMTFEKMDYYHNRYSVKYILSRTDFNARNERV